MPVPLWLQPATCLKDLIARCNLQLSILSQIEIGAVLLSVPSGDIMTKLTLAKRIASIVVYGHVALFAYGLIIMLFSGYDRIDTFQMILMGSPLLAMVALAAYRFIANLPAVDQSEPADSTWVNMSTVVTAAFLVCLFATYSIAMFNTNVEAATLKTIVGGIETALGGYLGVNRETLFPDAPKG